MADLDRSYLVADVRNREEMEAFSAAISDWEKRLLIFHSHTDRLHDSNKTLYALLMKGEAALGRGKVRRRMGKGDMVVIAPGVEVSVDRSLDFLLVAYDGPPPDHFDESFLQSEGFQVYVFDPAGKYESSCGFRKEVIDAADFRCRIQYHFVEINDPGPHTHEDMVELYYVLYGKGHIGLGESLDRLEKVPVCEGYVVAVGTSLYHPPSNGLGTSILFLRDEATYQRLKHQDGEDL